MVWRRQATCLDRRQVRNDWRVRQGMSEDLFRELERKTVEGVAGGGEDDSGLLRNGPIRQCWPA